MLCMWKKWTILGIVILSIGLSGWFIFRDVIGPWLIGLSIENMAGEGSYQISHGLNVYKTSATTYTLCDSDGFGLVNGELDGIYYSAEEHLIVVSYFPFQEFDEKQAETLMTNKLLYAWGRINSSGNVIDGKMLSIEKTQSNKLLIDRKEYNVNLLQPIDLWFRKKTR